jgi:hypothetical protein
MLSQKLRTQVGSLTPLRGVINSEYSQVSPCEKSFCCLSSQILRPCPTACGPFVALCSLCVEFPVQSIVDIISGNLGTQTEVEAA